VVGDDDEVWRAGAVALAEAPLLPSDGAPSSEVAMMARQVHDLAAEAQRVESPTGRAGLYGRLLTTCSRCHEQLGRWTAR
jgi:cytochrome c553